jgi:dolichol-phosphate mannosyltransferase
VARKDSGVKRITSRIANAVRARLLGDATPDSGCGLKVFPRALFLDFPRFDHMHRYLPALALRAGARVVSEPVNHRPRIRGRSNYGTLDRLAVSFLDLLGVIWLRRRWKRPAAEPIPMPEQPR